MTTRDSNAILARWARDALREYDRVSGGGVTEEALIPLLVASLLHLGTQRNLNPCAVMGEALKLFAEEQANA